MFELGLGHCGQLEWCLVSAAIQIVQPVEEQSLNAMLQMLKVTALIWVCSLRSWLFKVEEE